MRVWAALGSMLALSTGFAEDGQKPTIVPLDAISAPTGIAGEAYISEPLEQFVEFVMLQDWQRARILADEILDTNEGLPRFDLYYGVLLIHEQAYDLAIFPLERVLLVRPDQHRARLELGRAYFLLSNFERAKRELQQVMTTNPPPAVQSKVNDILSAIEKIQLERDIIDQVGINVLIGRDSNANGGSGLTDELDPNLLGLTELSGDSSPVATAYGQWSINYALIKPTSQNSSQRLLADYTQKFYSEPDLPTSHAFTLGGLIVNQQAHLRSTLPITAQLISSERKLTNLIFDANYQLEMLTWGPLWVGVKIGTQPSISLIESTATSVKDMASINLSAAERGRVHTFNSQYLQVSLSGQEDEHNEWRGMANTYSLDWFVKPNMSVTSAFEHQWRVYKADDLFFTISDESTQLKRRQDHIINLKSQFNWQANKWLKSQTSVSFESINSNINAYGRNRFNLSQAFNVQF